MTIGLHTMKPMKNHLLKLSRPVAGHSVRVTLLSSLVCALQFGCANTSVQVGLHTRSAVYVGSLMGPNMDVRSILISTPPRVGTLQGVSPSAPLRGLAGR